MVVRGHQDLDANIVRWGLHHLLDGGGCVHRPQSPTTDYAPPPPQPQRARALLDGYDMPAAAPAPAPAAAEVRVDAVVNDEVITHALQEELTQVAMAEASGPTGARPSAAPPSSRSSGSAPRSSAICPQKKQRASVRARAPKKEAMRATARGAR